MSSFDLKNSAGELAVAKDSKHPAAWKFTKPADAPADGDAINSLLGAIESAKATAIVSEKPDYLGKYGLASPSITFTATSDKSEKSTLVIGTKGGNAYFARDLARPQIFRVDAISYKKLGRNICRPARQKSSPFRSATDRSRRAPGRERDGVLSTKKAQRKNGRLTRLPTRRAKPPRPGKFFRLWMGFERTKCSIILRPISPRCLQSLRWK